MIKNINTSHDADLMYLAVKYCELERNNLSIDWIYNPKKMLSEKSVVFEYMSLSCHYTAKELQEMDNYAVNCL